MIEFNSKTYYIEKMVEIYIHIEEADTMIQDMSKSLSIITTK
jgi:hypothetical protein